jgi:hypothetical protein
MFGASCGTISAAAVNEAVVVQRTPGGGIMELDKDLLEILACPVCKGPLRMDESSLVCTSCRLRYPIRDGIPVLLAEEAERAGEE